MKRIDNFFKRSWADLRTDEHWLRQLLLLTLAIFIPIVGPFIVGGYLANWGREAAWGMSRGLACAPNAAKEWKRHLKYGVWSIGIKVIWYLPAFLAIQIVSAIAPLGLLTELASLVVLVLIEIAIVFAIIYEKFGVGLKVKRVWAMAKADWNGIWRLVGLQVATNLVGAVAAIILLLPVGIALGVSMGFALSGSDLGEALLTGITSNVLIALLLVPPFMYLVMLIDVVVDALNARAAGLFVAQFEPAKWTGPDDEMPFEKEPTAEPEPAAKPEPSAPTAPEPAAPAPEPEPTPVEEPEVIDVEFEEVACAEAPVDPQHEQQ